MPIWRQTHELARVTVHYMGVSITAIAVTGICGQISHQAYMYTWGFSGTMSFPTAISLIMTGVGLFLVSRGEASHADGGE